MSWDMLSVLGTWGRLVTLCTPQRVGATSFAHPETGTQGPRQMANQALGSWYANVTALRLSVATHFCLTHSSDEAELSARGHSALLCKLGKGALPLGRLSLS